MAANFWTSSHRQVFHPCNKASFAYIGDMQSSCPYSCTFVLTMDGVDRGITNILCLYSTHWILDRRRLEEAMREDLEYVDIATLTKIKMWYYNIIGKIGKRLQFRQQVIATAIVYFKRFYTKNSMRSTDPSLVAATCIYLACKIEECPQHIKHIITEMKGALGNHGGFDYDVSKVAEFEFYLLEELEFYLIVYHPYRDLTLIAKELKLEESNLQTAWFVVNDSYRTDVCLLYAPHMIALAALYIICVVHAERNTDSNGGNGGGGSGGGIAGGSGGTMGDDSSGGGGNMIASHAHSNMHLHAQLHSMATKKGGSGGHHTSEGHGINNRNMVQWFAELNVDIEEIIEITQEMLSLYTIWKDYNEESIPAMVQSLKRSIMPASPQQQQQQQPSQQQPSQQSQQYQQQGIQQ